MREGLPPPPPSIQALALDPRGYPIPWFVYVDEAGAADFRIVGPGKVASAMRNALCWICGKRLGRMKSFVIGPMCAINRVSSEPPSHPECAVWAAQACPFLTRPLAKRRDQDGELDTRVPGGIMIARNPGVTLVWGCLRFSPFYPPGGGVLFDIGPPMRVAWYREGRAASREEVEESILSGMPILEAEAEKDGIWAMKELRERAERARQLLPKAAA
jgi:hypothetical protein